MAQGRGRLSNSLLNKLIWESQTFGDKEVQSLTDEDLRKLVSDIKDFKKGQVKSVLRSGQVAKSIQTASEGVGLLYTTFLVGKHLANGDVKGLGFDALNLYAMPKLGQTVGMKLTSLGEKMESTSLKVGGPVLGRAVGNFAAFLGLYEAIQQRKTANNVFDKVSPNK